jgi:hypothetical protein
MVSTEFAIQNDWVTEGKGFVSNGSGITFWAMPVKRYSPSGPNQSSPLPEIGRANYPLAAYFFNQLTSPSRGIQKCERHRAEWRLS